MVPAPSNDRVVRDGRDPRRDASIVRRDKEEPQRATDPEPTTALGLSRRRLVRTCNPHALIVSGKDRLGREHVRKTEVCSPSRE